jgi:hypothetical protein
VVSADLVGRMVYDRPQRIAAFLILFVLFPKITMNSIKNYNRDFRETVHSTRNVIVKSGSLPIVITALHGGLDRPSSIPDRKQEGSLLLADMHTKEIAEAVGRGIHDHFKYAAPHVVLSKVSRRKVDLNRSLKEGTESANGAKVWQEYHGYVQEAINSVLKDHPHGILFDFHGKVFLTLKLRRYLSSINNKLLHNRAHSPKWYD